LIQTCSFSRTNKPAVIKEKWEIEHGKDEINQFSANSLSQFCTFLKDNFQEKRKGKKNKERE
jgi:hypothetical protein